MSLDLFQRGDFYPCLVLLNPAMTSVRGSKVRMVVSVHLSDWFDVHQFPQCPTFNSQGLSSVHRTPKSLDPRLSLTKKYYGLHLFHICRLWPCILSKKCLFIRSPIDLHRMSHKGHVHYL